MDHRIDGVTQPTEEAAPTEGARSSARITVVVQSRFVVEAGPATGREIKQLAEIPPDSALYRRARGGNEPIHDDDVVHVRNGDHFFARQPTSIADG